jgi:F-type H+-transporting ATPase subunit gamma
MANLKDISRQIRSVKNTQKTTKAMKLVSSAKLRKAQELSAQTKSYAIKINEILSQITYMIRKVHNSENLSKAFVASNDPKTIDVVFITADKGLCGGFNMATIKYVRELIQDCKDKGITLRLRAAGRKGIDYFNFQGVDILQKELGLTSAPT